MHDDFAKSFTEACTLPNDHLKTAITATIFILCYETSAQALHITVLPLVSKRK